MLYCIHIECDFLEDNNRTWGNENINLIGPTYLYILALVNVRKPFNNEEQTWKQLLSCPSMYKSWCDRGSINPDTFFYHFFKNIFCLLHCCTILFTCAMKKWVVHLLKTSNKLVNFKDPITVRTLKKIRTRLNYVKIWATYNCRSFFRRNTYVYRGQMKKKLTKVNCDLSLRFERKFIFVAFFAGLVTNFISHWNFLFSLLLFWKFSYYPVIFLWSSQ